MSDTISPMMNHCIQSRATLLKRLDHIRDVEQHMKSYSRLSQFGAYLVLACARFGLFIAYTVVSLSIHWKWSSQQAFEKLARRKENGEFIESYAAFTKRRNYVIATALSVMVLVAVQLITVGWSLRPTTVEAYSTSSTITDSYDVTAFFQDASGNTECESVSATTLKAGLSAGADVYQTVLEFPLSAIPSTAVVTKVELIANVTKTYTTSNPIINLTADRPDQHPDCSDNFNDLRGVLATASWTTLGSKTITLSANAQVQSRIATGYFSLILTGTGMYGTINSMDNGSNMPQLRVTYTLPPQAPTAATPNHSAITTSTITWNWIDHATADSAVTASQRIMSGATVKCSTTGDGATTGATMSCQETGLTPNTAITRQPNTLDPDGNSSGPDMTAYTAIETPAGIQFDSIGSDSITLSATGSISNLAGGQSGLYFENPAYSNNSGWLKTNSWTFGLVSNTTYTFTVRAKNGDGVTTNPVTSAAVTTLPALPSILFARPASTWFNTPDFVINEQEVFGSGGLIQYYRYVWDQNATHAFTNTESTWSDTSSDCPSTCTSTGYSITVTASTPSDHWYFHLKSYNSANVSNGDGTDYGPFQFDSTPPTTPSNVYDGTDVGSDHAYSTSLTTLSANWTSAADLTSGLLKYEYAVGTTPGGTATTGGWIDNGTATSISNDTLSLTNGSTYYFSVRGVDNAGNTGLAATSNGILVNANAPTIDNHQTGDLTPRRLAGTTYDVRFTKASTGPQLAYAQYAVGSTSGGTDIITWTDIFRTNVDTFSTPWVVDFSSLHQGTNYVSVRVYALDELSSQQNGVFTILKDTVAPLITSFVSAPSATSAIVSWTTNEPASTQLEYGLTTSYGTTTTLDATLTTSHMATLTGIAATTTFHARANSTDAAGNTAASSDLSFTTSAGAHTYISNVAISNIDSTSVGVTWTTNEPATSKVRYGTTTDYGAEVVDTTLVTSHQLAISGLQPSTVYHYEVISVGSTTDNDADATFKTAAATAETPTVPEPVLPPSCVTPPPSEVVTPTISDTEYLRVTADTTPAITGTGPANGSLFVVVDRVLVRTVPIDATGHYSVDLNIPLSLGTHAIVVRAKDADGEVSDESAPLIISVVQGGMGTTITSRRVTDGDHPTITFGAVAPANMTVKIFLDAMVIKTISTATATPPVFSFFATIVPSSGLSAGKHTISFVTINSHGRPSMPTGLTTFTKTMARDDDHVIVYHQATTYTVQSGDSLWSIAEELLGDGRKYRSIVAANSSAHPSLVTHPNAIRPGWALTIPH